jgi:hypothetical protein
MSRVDPKLRALPAERCLAVLLDDDAVRMFRIEDDQVDELRNPGPPAEPAPGPAAPSQPAHSRRRPSCLPPGQTLPVLGAAACAHVHRTADRVACIVRAEHIDRILAGGVPECVAELRRILRARLGGDIELLPLATDASALQVGEAARDAARAEPTCHEEEVLGELLEAVGRGLAALGVGPVLDAINEHRASVLIVARGTAIPGAYCPACQAAFAPPVAARCLACGATLAPSDDLVDHLARRVREQGGLLEDINRPAGDALRAHGGIAALLRYAFPGAGLASTWAETSA